MKSNAKKSSSRGICLVKTGLFLIAVTLFASMELFPIMEAQRDVTRTAIGGETWGSIREPRIRIIVKLDVTDIVELTRASNAYGVILPGCDFPRAGRDADRRLEDAIRNTVVDVLDGLDKGTYRINRLYASIPYLALSLSSAAMSELIRHPRVLSVTEDIPEPLASPMFTDDAGKRESMPVGSPPDTSPRNDTPGIVGAARAWNMGYTGSGWYVAVLDTGVLADHEFFRGKTIVESCFASGVYGSAGNGGDCPNGRSTMHGFGAAAPYERFLEGYGHGTHAAGIAAGNNGSVFGIAKDADIIAVQVFSRSPSMQSLSSWISDQAAGLDYIYSIRGVYSIASVNLGVTESVIWKGHCDADIRKAIMDNLRAAGIATCIPTGDNDSCSGVSAPACISGCIPVGAATDADEKAVSSNWHPGMQKLFAPGSGIYSSLPDSDSRYGRMSGTMTAAPHVSGAWALLKQVRPEGSVDELLTALAITGPEVTTPCDGFSRGIPGIRIDEAIGELTSGSIRVVSPAGSERWPAASTRRITWTSGGDIDKVHISYSTDGGNTWKTIVRNTDDDGDFLWDIPEEPSEDCLVRISDADGIPRDDSDMFFSIVPPAADEITVTSPNGGENLDSGSHHAITWTSSGEIQNVMIEYSYDDGENWHGIVGSTANDGTYDWVVPQTGSNQCRVRITGMDGDNDPGVMDISDQVFSIISTLPGSLTLRSPNGGESWYAGSLQTIEWSGSGNIDNIGIRYSVDNGTSWKEIVPATANDGVFEWTVPGTVSAQCLVGIYGADGGLDPIPSDTGDAVFAIVFTASLDVTAPNGGESMTVGSRRAIRWRPADSRDTAKIEYSFDGGGSWSGITGNTRNDGEYQWLVPDTPSDDCLVRVSEVNSLRSDVSDGVFSIARPAGSDILVLAPNGGESWTAGSNRQITWSAESLIEAVTISYSPDDGGTWREIVDTTPNTGVFEWTVPDTVSENCLVRVTGVGRGQDPLPADVSDAVFAIVFSGVLRVTAPNGGESMTAGSRRSIEWRPADSRDNAKIEYSINGGDSWAEIVGDTPNDGEYQWLVPDTPSETCLVRISENGSRQVDISDAVFTIVQPADPDITVTVPNGGEQWTAASIKEISWTGGSEVNNVSLEYSPDNGMTWIMIRETTENDGGYDWTVPDTVSANCRVRITAADGDPDPRSSDTSDAVFAITADVEELRVLKPNGGESWEVDTVQTISWSGGGGAGNVMIEHSWDHGASWSVIAAFTANDGSHDWRIPDFVSNACFIRVTAVVGGDISAKTDTGDSPFAIVYPQSPTVRILTPNGGEQLVPGSDYPITWFSTDSRQKKNLEYSVDGGRSWKEIAADLEDDGGYTWRVPDEPSDNCLVRVGEEDGDPVDLSDAVFSIVASSAGDITVLTPNGGENLQAGSEFEITWNQTGLNLVNIEYSTTNGATWMFVARVNADNGSYTWAVPAVSSKDCLVRVSGSGADENHVDASDDVFSITDPDGAAVEVFTPNGGEQLTAGTAYDITWGSRGIEQVLIEYSPDNEESWQDIATVSAANGRYTWTVPDTPSEICRIRITAVGAAPGPSDDSDAVFTISAN